MKFYRHLVRNNDSEFNRSRNGLMRHLKLISLIILFAINLYNQSLAQTSLNNQKIDGYRGIWFTLGQFSEYGDKYSGGLGTYTAKHLPLAIYALEVNKTFFVYGGTSFANEKHLLCMISYYDHKTKTVPKPTVVYDKLGVDDPHDDPSLAIDNNGFLWVFVSGRGRARMGFKYKSDQPYSTDSFTQITEEEMTYPQPLYDQQNGFSQEDLENMLPLECVQLIQDSHAGLLGVMLLITDMAGKPITRPSNPCGLFNALKQAGMESHGIRI